MSRRRDSLLQRGGEALVYALGRTFQVVTRPVPLWPLTDAMAAITGSLVPFVPGFRARIEENLDLVRPDLDRTARLRLMRAAAGHFTRTMVEYAHFNRFHREVRLEVEGIEHLHAAAADRGAILVTAHYGNWEAARIAAQRAGVECGIIYRAFNNRYVDRRALQVIPAAGAPVLQKGPGGMRGLLGVVARRGVIMVLIDQRNTGAPLIDFLGQPAETVTIAAEVAARTGAALIPVVARRNVGARRFDVAFEAPVEPGDPQVMMAAVNDRIGAWIEADPDQWLWFHRRWKRRGHGIADGATRRAERGRGVQDPGA